MALINFARREIEAKIVYYGPALSGKTTNVVQAFQAISSDDKGDLRKIATADERTLYFDYAPITRGDIAGFTVKFKLFSVPGQIAYKETRRIVLQGVDGVVFVADSGPERVQSNLESMMDLEGNLRHHGLEPGRIPLVIQFNKRDLKSARSVQSLNSDLNPLGVPIVEAVAAQGRGVTEALEAITDIVSARIRDSLSGRRSGLTLTALDAREAPDDESLVNRYIKEIDQVRPQEEAYGRAMMAKGQVDRTEIDAFLLENVERADDSGDFQGEADPTQEHSEPPPAAHPSRSDPLADLVSDLPNEPSAELPATPLSTSEHSHSPIGEALSVALGGSASAFAGPETRSSVLSELPVGPDVKLGFLPGSLSGYQTTRIIDAELLDGGVRLDLLMEDASGGGIGRCTVRLLPESRYLSRPRAPRRKAIPRPPKRTGLYIGLISGGLVLGLALGAALF